MWMPCIYGMASWMGLRFKDEAIIFDTFREMYEAFVIYHFFTYLIVYLEQNDTIESLLARKAVQGHIWPMNHLMKARGWAAASTCETDTRNFAAALSTRLCAFTRPVTMRR